MKMTGIKAIIIERGVEYAVEVLAKLLDELRAELGDKPQAPPAPETEAEPVVEEVKDNG